MTRSVALATCAQLPSGDEDATLAQAALAGAGIEASWHSWDDAAVDWSTFDLVVVRSVWDYPRDRDAFIAWARGVPRLANPAAVLAWNTDKTYLREIVEAGVPVVPTEWTNPGEPVRLPGGEVVVKPSVGAGSIGAGRFGGDAHGAARAHAATLHDAGRTVMVQPYLAHVDTAGETALIYLDGTFSHAVRKGAMLPPSAVNELATGSSAELFVPECITAREPDAAERRLGQLVLDVVRERFGAPLLYARVDVLPSADGPVLIELELTEPSLFLGYDEGAARRFATAVARRLS